MSLPTYVFRASHPRKADKIQIMKPKKNPKNCNDLFLYGSLTATLLRLGGKPAPVNLTYDIAHVALAFWCHDLSIALRLRVVGMALWRFMVTPIIAFCILDAGAIASGMWVKITSLQTSVAESQWTTITVVAMSVLTIS
ncbi:hypothetical protein L218DRAFT_948116 [Marasmius fiardii PR-910]|nr:hypothetical protein L218DRAFT_948116 [Marasmius fiardii PR-910]